MKKIVNMDEWYKLYRKLVNAWEKADWKEFDIAAIDDWLASQPDADRDIEEEEFWDWMNEGRMKVYQIYCYNEIWDSIVGTYLSKEKALKEKERLEKEENEKEKCNVCPVNSCPSDCDIDCKDNSKCNEYCIRKAKEFCGKADIIIEECQGSKILECKNDESPFYLNSYKIIEVEVIE